jgi:hypothetical protein
VHDTPGRRATWLTRMGLGLMRGRGARRTLRATVCWVEVVSLLGSGASERRAGSAVASPRTSGDARTAATAPRATDARATVARGVVTRCCARVGATARAACMVCMALYLRQLWLGTYNSGSNRRQTISVVCEGGAGPTRTALPYLLFAPAHQSSSSNNPLGKASVYHPTATVGDTLGFPCVRW